MKSNIQKGLVSTIIPVYNRSAMIKEAVESVLQQTYRPIEIIIVDDGSTDHTVKVLQELSKKHDEISVVTQKNAGPGVAREAGRQIAKGEYIQYLDSDDLLLKNKFTWQVQALLKSQHCGIAYGKTEHLQYGRRQRHIAWKRTGEKINSMFPAFLMSRWWGTSTPLYRRIVTDEAGAWLSLRNEEDWEYDSRIASQGVKLAYVDEFISVQRVHGNHLSDCGDRAPHKLADRALAREKIYRHALESEISHKSYEMRHFSKYAFLLSRQCAEAGVLVSARNLFQLSVKSNDGASLKHRLYWCLVMLFGWRNTARLATLLK